MKKKKLFKPKGTAPKRGHPKATGSPQSEVSGRVHISQFKSGCLGFLNQTRLQGKEYIITKRGVPIAQVIPIKKRAITSRRGSLKGMAEIQGDIVHFDSSKDWEAAQ